MPTFEEPADPDCATPLVAPPGLAAQGVADSQLLVTEPRTQNRKNTIFAERMFCCVL